MTVKERIKRDLFWFIFLLVFDLVGITVLIFGLVRVGLYLNADITSASVISAEYGAGETATVEFEYLKDGQPVKVTAKFEDVSPFDKQGRRPYYEGKEVNLHLSKSGKILQFTKLETLMLICGASFVLAGSGFIYFLYLRKPSAIDLVISYEQAMVSPEVYADETQKNEARADELSKLRRNSVENFSGSLQVWRRRMGDRLKTFTPLHRFVFAFIAIAPPLAYNIYRAVKTGKFKFGVFVAELFIWVFLACIIGFILKFLLFAFLKAEVKAGRYNVKKTAKIKACAFESEAYFANGDLRSIHIIGRKFRVVAEIDGKRSVGYVYGNVPPPKGAILNVLVRKRNLRRFIIDVGN